ncbi:sulfurtransferase, partial [Bacillus thuringiensis]|nr:sulfurtransferase [Bacillus thuringiensis]
MNTILSTLFIVLAAWFVISRFLPVKGVQNISGKQLKNIVGKKGKQLIDVRTVSEYRG